MKRSVDERGRITIPKTLRDRLNINGGQTLALREEAGRLVVTPHPDAIDLVYGRFASPHPTDSVIHELRRGRVRIGG